MPADRNALKVGIVTIVVIITSFAILIWISQGVGGEKMDVTIRFRSTPDMPTLAKGSDILVGGQKVGKVKKLPSLETQPFRDAKTKQMVDTSVVVVETEIQKMLEGQIRRDCKVTAEGPPLGGDGLIKIDLGQSDIRWKQGEVIDGAEPGGFAAIVSSLQAEFNADDPHSLLGEIKVQLSPEAEMSLMAKLHNSFNDLNQISASLNHQLTSEDRATLIAKFQEIADNINVATGAIRAEFGSERSEVLLGKLHIVLDTVNDGLVTLARVIKTNEPVINKTFTHVETAAGNVAAETDPARAGSLMAHFKTAGETLNKTLADMQTVSGTAREVMVLNRQNINRMLANFKEASDQVRTGLKYVLQHPWRLMNAPKASETKQDAINDAARSFAEAATRIDDASAKLKALSDLHDGAIPVNDPDLLRIQEELKATQEKYHRAETEFWRQLKVD